MPSRVHANRAELKRAVEVAVWSGAAVLAAATRHHTSVCQPTGLLLCSLSIINCRGCCRGFCDTVGGSIVLEGV